MAFTRIKDSDLAGKGVKDQSTVPGLSAEEMKASVEQIVREVAIPGVNRLVDELGAETAAGNIGMPVPSTMPPETGATVEEIATAHIENKENPHGVTAAQVGAYTKAETDAAIDQKVQAIGAADMSKAEFATNGRPGIVDKAVTAENADSATAADDGVKVYTHSRSGTVNELTGDGPNGRALMTADVQPGDTWTVNGQLVTAYMGAEDATDSMAGRSFNGKWITFVIEDDVLAITGCKKYSPPAYSTSEWVPTGETWIDGKPIYQKVLNAGYSNNETITELSNADNIVQCGGYFQYSDAPYVSIFPSTETNPSRCCTFKRQGAGQFTYEIAWNSSPSSIKNVSIMVKATLK